MGCRRLSGDERHACTLMARIRVSGGANHDDIRSHLAMYLVARGWSRRAAIRRAGDVVTAVLAGD